MDATIRDEKNDTPPFNNGIINSRVSCEVLLSN